MGTPSISDDEETGDYDDVIGLLSPLEEQAGVVGKGRSRQSSYADLQRLRMAPLSVQTRSVPANMQDTSNNTGPPTQSQHRVRRPSLSDGVAVSRIAAEDPNEPFSEATQNLIDEIHENK
jgi:glycerol-3-phosphate O-acyltransferase/dihydroxyacetone phosphate acyltransferase